MSAVRKFLFDTSFDPGLSETAAGERADLPLEKAPPPPSFSEAELEAAREEAFAAGREAGAAEALGGLEQRIATALESATAQIETLLADQAAAAETRRAVAMRLSIKAIETLFPTLLQSTALAEIEAAIGSALTKLEDEPRVVIRVADEAAEPLRERLAGLGAEARFGGQLVLLPDGALGPGAARVEWASGGAERDSNRLWQELRAVIEAHLAGLPESALPEAPAPTSPAPESRAPESPATA